MGNNCTHPRRGSVSLETLILIPLGMALLLGVIEFGMLLANKTLVESATAQAGRVAAQGGSEQEIRAALKRVLGPQRFKLADVYMTSTPDGTPLRTGDPVEVRVEILARDVVPNLLTFVGFGLGDHKLTGRAVLRME
jgi:hypothetical protein